MMMVAQFYCSNRVLRLNGFNTYITSMIALYDLPNTLYPISTFHAQI